MLPRTLALVVLILGSLTAVLGGGYLATQGQVGLRLSDAASVTPAPPAEKLPAQATCCLGEPGGVRRARRTGAAGPNGGAADPPPRPGPRPVAVEEGAAPRRRHRRPWPCRRRHRRWPCSRRRPRSIRRLHHRRAPRQAMPPPRRAQRRLRPPRPRAHRWC